MADMRGWRATVVLAGGVDREGTRTKEMHRTPDTAPGSLPTSSWTVSR